MDVPSSVNDRYNVHGVRFVAVEQPPWTDDDLAVASDVVPIEFGNNSTGGRVRRELANGVIDALHEALRG